MCAEEGVLCGLAEVRYSRFTSLDTEYSNPLGPLYPSKKITSFTTCYPPHDLSTTSQWVSSWPTASVDPSTNDRPSSQLPYSLRLKSVGRSPFLMTYRTPLAYRTRPTVSKWSEQSAVPTSDLPYSRRLKSVGRSVGRRGTSRWSCFGPPDASSSTSTICSARARGTVGYGSISSGYGRLRSNR